ncbi:DUF3011 domain-containing protein [Marinicella rhabdoformis]|uniref:DUF3011 domain-containing protein n=1 Tax=Marinicella rhabdoformis TaxID=2580566 RepID=UPI0015D031B9|nr:DUF3011 domain-containing protein [Marinicella rhabdoformis]
MNKAILTIITVFLTVSYQPKAAAQKVKRLPSEHNSNEANYQQKQNKRNRQSNNNDRITCKSKNGRRAHCQINTQGGIRLVKELSRGKCRGNWGYDYYGVWVTNSCRAKFTTDRYQDHWGNNYNKDHIVRCESYRLGKQICTIGHNLKNVKVQLIHQLSARDCSGNWGHNNKEIWVINGCKADFKIQRNNKPNANHRPGQVTNELVCLSKKYRRHYCDMPRLKDVKLVEVMSKAEKTCFNNWGFDAKGIWVDNNCKARFHYTQKGNRSGNWQDRQTNNVRQHPDTPRLLKCKSRSNTKKTCARNIRKAELNRSISKGKFPCKGNWGIDRSGDLFVKNNCYAEFKVWD